MIFLILITILITNIIIIESIKPIYSIVLIAAVIPIILTLINTF